MSKVKTRYRTDHTSFNSGVNITQTLDNADKKRKINIINLVRVDTRSWDGTTKQDQTSATAWNATRGASTGQFAPNTITSLRIEGKANSYLMSKVGRVLFLKKTVSVNATGIPALPEIIVKKAGAPDAAQNNWGFALTHKNDQALRRENNTLVLEVPDDFEEVPTTRLGEIVDINDRDYDGATGTEPALWWDYTPALNGLIALETLLESCYDKFGTRQWRRNGTPWTFYSEKQTLPSQQDIQTEGKKLEEYSIFKGTGHNLTFTDRNIGADGRLTGGGKATANEDPARIKSVLYELESGITGGAPIAYYSHKIDDWLSYLDALFNWKRGGFATNHEIAIVRRLGFQVADVGSFKDKKFMGFEVLKDKDGNDLEIEKAPDGGTGTGELRGRGFKIKGSNNCNNETYTNAKINYVNGNIDFSGAHNEKPENYIRALRTLEVGNVPASGIADPFWYDKGGTMTSIFADESRTDRRSLFGFQPQDIDFTQATGGTANNFSNAGSKLYQYLPGVGGRNLKDRDMWVWVKNFAATNKHLSTRIKCKLTGLSDNNQLERVIKIAFAGWSDYNTKDCSHQLDPEIPAGLDNWNKAHNSKQDVLDDYYDFIKLISPIWPGTSNANKYIPTGQTYNSIPGDADTQKAVDKLNGCHAEAQKWARIWGTSYSSSNKAQATADKPILEAFITATNEPDSTDCAAWMRYWINQNPTWKALMDKKLIEITNAITGTPPTPPKDTIDDLIKKGSDIAKKIYAEAKANGGYGGTDKPSDELKNLVSLIEKAKGDTADASTLTNLREYSKATDASDNEKKKAWDIANGVKDSGIIANSTNGAGADALQKLEDELTTAKDAAKKAMDNESGAYDAIGVDSLDDKKKIEKITEIWNKAKAAWNETAHKDPDTGNHITELNGFKSNNPTEWGEVDKYTGKGGGGYASGALKHLNELKEQKKAAIKDMKNSKDGNEAIEKWKNADNKNGIEEDDALRIAGHVELKNSSDADEKKLSDLLGEKDTADDFKDDSDDELDKIKNFINDLKEYVKDIGKDTGKGKAVKKLQEKITDFKDPKKVLESWISKLESRKSTLEQKQQERNKDKNNPTQEKGNWDWLTSTPMLFVYGVVAIGVLGGLAWLAIKGGSEEGEGGEE